MNREWRHASDRNWFLVAEGFTLAREHEIESLFAISNGNAGTRGSLEEGSLLSAPATFIAGIFRHPAAPGMVPELLNFPNWVGTKVWVNGSPLSMQEGHVLEHRRLLDLKQAILRREWRHKDLDGRITRFNSLRLASLSDRHILLQQIVLTAENYCPNFTIESSIELAPEFRPMLPPKWNVVTDANRTNLLPLALILRDGKVKAAVCIATKMVAQTWRCSEREVDFADQRVTERFRIQAGPGASCELHRVVAILTARQDKQPLETALGRSTAAASAGIGSLVSAHQAEWQKRWKAADVQIEGDDPMQLALRFAVYHLISAASPQDSRVSIGARALTGQAYKGHVFWDTEIYMLPFYCCTDPASARALLGYRYHTLPAAREKARAAGYRGAMYAWESADTGDEVTPGVAITPGGETIPVLNAEMEVHITADIAFAIWQYWNATGDNSFLLDFGAEIIIESARFWASRGRLESDGFYHIRHVIGPDEYHENVDDNAYTNLMAAWNLRRGADVADLLRTRWTDRWHQLAERLQLTEAEPIFWSKLADAMATGFDSGSLLYEQFAGYFEKDQIDLRTYEPRFTAVDVILGPKRVQQTNIVKQPDVVMAIYLLWDQFSPDVREANFRYYEPRTAHGSSLSPSIHAAVAARLGHMDLARKYLKQSAEVDLGNNMGNAAGGVHVAALGGLWQAAIFGFAGVQGCSDGVTLSPHLLSEWRRLSFPLQWGNHCLQISIEPEAIKVSTTGTSPVKVSISNGPALLATPNRNYIAVRQPNGWEAWRVLD